MVEIKESKRVEGKKIAFKNLSVGDIFKFLGDKYVVLYTFDNIVRVYNIDTNDTEEFIANNEDCTLLMRNGEHIIVNHALETREVVGMANLKVGDVFKLSKYDSSFIMYLGKVKEESNNYICMNLDTGIISDNWGRGSYFKYYVVNPEDISVSFNPDALSVHLK